VRFLGAFSFSSRRKEKLRKKKKKGTKVPGLGNSNGYNGAQKIRVAGLIF